MLYRWTQRLQSTWTRRGRPASEAPALPCQVQPSAARRVEVCPPDRLYKRSRWRGGLRDWLNTGWDVSSPAALPVDRLAAAAAASPEPEPTPFADIRQEFADTLNDIDTDRAADLRAQIERARSPRELWHLRSALFTLVAMHHSESQAQSRMERLNRHFPNRTQSLGPGMRSQQRSA
ncbi:MAG: hypothetical protein Q7T97_09570 [Burkholderiaceae bacterium]|nr:hypothetical protein [Burkholderiaceae bacterium]